jgi:hypothetical protein
MKTPTPSSLGATLTYWGCEPHVFTKQDEDVEDILHLWERLDSLLELQRSVVPDIGMGFRLRNMWDAELEIGIMESGWSLTVLLPYLVGSFSVLVDVWFADSEEEYLYADVRSRPPSAIMRRRDAQSAVERWLLKGHLPLYFRSLETM